MITISIIMMKKVIYAGLVAGTTLILGGCLGNQVEQKVTMHSVVYDATEVMRTPYNDERCYNKDISGYERSGRALVMKGDEHYFHTSCITSYRVESARMEQTGNKSSNSGDLIRKRIIQTGVALERDQCNKSLDEMLSVSEEELFKMDDKGDYFYGNCFYLLK